MTSALLQSDNLDSWSRHGYCYFPKQANPLPAKEIEYLDKLIEEKTCRWVSIRPCKGTGRHHSTLTSIIHPDDCGIPEVRSATAFDLMKFINSREVSNFFQSIIGTNQKLICRRAQVNELNTGDHVAAHRDTNVDKKFQLSVILHLRGLCSGGEFALESPTTKEVIEIPTEPGSLILLDPSVPHRVNKVTSGNRRTLVFFLSTYGGPVIKASERSSSHMGKIALKVKRLLQKGS